MVRRRYSTGTARPYGPSVIVSFVLRLRSKELAEGRITGEMEAVTTGERRAIRSIDEVNTFCTEMGQEVERRSIEEGSDVR